jgi:predicted TIM-barrel fold metal-dependent hydrolase
MPVKVEHIIDVDTHEMVPYHMWTDVFGAEGGLANPIFDQPGNLLEGNVILPEVKGDTSEITSDRVRNMKGSAAPGAIDLERRPKAMDAVGIERQLVFAGFGAVALWLLCANKEKFEWTFRVKVPDDLDIRQVGSQMIGAHNNWVMSITKSVGDRVRPVAIITNGEVAEMTEQAEQLLAGGARALQLTTSTPPAGLSPGDRALAPLWRVAEEANVPIVIHTGSDFGFLSSSVWGAISDFKPEGWELDPYNKPIPRDEGIEFPGFDPFSGSTQHYCNENYLTAIVLGGVFERHPNLRFGVIESGADWFGPLAERLDLWSGEFKKRALKTMSMPPSQYLARNVRVTPFHFEPVARYFERWPALQTSYCFSSDYPHIEGGRDSIQTFLDALGPYGEDALERFFVSNGSWLLPE